MPSRPSQHSPAATPRKDLARDTQKASLEDADNSGERDRDLVHGEGGTIGVPDKPRDLSQDD